MYTSTFTILKYSLFSTVRRLASLLIFYSFGRILSVDWVEASNCAVVRTTVRSIHVIERLALGEIIFDTIKRKKASNVLPKNQQLFEDLL